MNTYYIWFIIILFCTWFVFINHVGSYTNDYNCLKHNCIASNCNGGNCRAGYCHGDNCKAGDCHGTDCVAGNCHGENCIPGKCKDPDCIDGICSQFNKKCIDGSQHKLSRPFYYYITKYLPYGTFFNPPLCDPNNKC
jgi:hypothetical protein